MPNLYDKSLFVHCNIDAMMPNFTFTRVLTEGAVGTDTVTPQKIRPVNLTEGAVGTDSVIKSIARTLTEGVPGIDTVLKTSARLLTEGAIGTDSVLHSFGRILTEGMIGTDVLKVVLNGSSVIWSHIQKSASATWSKITKATTTWTHIDHS